jgi:hypothetical protein
MLSQFVLVLETKIKLADALLSCAAHYAGRWRGPDRRARLPFAGFYLVFICHLARACRRAVPKPPPQCQSSMANWQVGGTQSDTYN